MESTIEIITLIKEIKDMVDELDSLMITGEDIRNAVEKSYPGMNDYEFSLEHSGILHENPVFAICVVLISSIVLDTTDPVKLVQFTKYSERFVGGIASNMENAGLWKDGKYDCSSWFSGILVPSKEPEDWAFWEQVLIAEGSQWKRGTDRNIVRDTSAIFWDDMRAEAKARGIMMWRRGKRIV